MCLTEGSNHGYKILSVLDVEPQTMITESGEQKGLKRTSNQHNWHEERADG